MPSLKDCWITPWDSDLYCLTLESLDTSENYTKLKAIETSFPDKPSDKHPLRHTISISLLHYNDLVDLYNVLEEALNRYK